MEAWTEGATAELCDGYLKLNCATEKHAPALYCWHNVTSIGALLYLQPMIPPGCSKGLDAFRLFFKSLQYNASSTAAAPSVVRNAVAVYGLLKPN